MTTPVPTQADRDAAHRWMGRLPRDQFDMLLLLMDEGARRAERATREACARIAEAASDRCERVAVAHFDHTAKYHNECRAMEAREIAAAIRNTENTDDK